MSVRATAIVALVAIGWIVVGRAESPTADASTVAVQVGGPAVVNAFATRLSPPPGNPGAVPLPAEALPVDTSQPDVVIGTGTPATCTSQAVVDAVAHGGIITFDCGPSPVSIVMTATAKVVNTSPSS